jgi:hypothetical protein
MQYFKKQYKEKFIKYYLGKFKKTFRNIFLKNI